MESPNPFYSEQKAKKRKLEQSEKNVWGALDGKE